MQTQSLVEREPFLPARGFQTALRQGRIGFHHAVAMAPRHKHIATVSQKFGDGTQIGSGYRLAQCGKGCIGGEVEIGADLRPPPCSVRAPYRFTSGAAKEWQSFDTHGKYRNEFPLLYSETLIARFPCPYHATPIPRSLPSSVFAAHLWGALASMKPRRLAPWQQGGRLTDEGRQITTIPAAPRRPTEAKPSALVRNLARQKGEFFF